MMNEISSEFLSVPQLRQLANYAPDGLVFRRDDITSEVYPVSLDNITVDEVWTIRVDGEEITAPKHEIIEMYEEDEYVMVTEFKAGVII